MNRRRGPAPFTSPVLAHQVELRVDASSVAGATVRAMAGDLAARSEYTLDAVADLRLAADEVCATLLHLARPRSRMTCAFAVDEERITVTASVSTTTSTTLPADTFGWRVLETLTEDLCVLAGTPRSPGDAHRLAIRFTVPRAGTVTRAAAELAEGGRA